MPREHCAICFHPERRSIDAVVITAQDQGHNPEDIMLRVLEVGRERNLGINFDVDELTSHIKRHPLLGLIEDQTLITSSVVVLPSGERVDISDPAQVYKNIIAAGIVNILTNPTSVRPMHVLEAVRGLREVQGSGNEMKELMELIRSKLQIAPPDHVDKKKNPYAAKSPVGVKDG